MNPNHRPYALLGLALSLSGCFVVDKGALDSLNLDNGTDAGMYPTSEVCNGSSYTINSPGEYEVTTLGASSDLNASLCSASRASPGPDVFLSLDAQEGQYWHFHVSKATTETAVLDPVVGLFQEIGGVCNTADCTNVSNRCSGDFEHFGVRIPATPAGAIWRLAIDSATDVGGRYNIAVFRPVCGNGINEHGEGCDDGGLCGDNTTPCTIGGTACSVGTCTTRDGDACDAKCRDEISTSGPNAQNEPNDDMFWANRVLVSSIALGGSAIDVSELVDGVCDPDVYVVAVPAGNAFRVGALGALGGACIPFNTAIPYAMTAQTASGATAGSIMNNAGCKELVVPALANSAEIFVTIDGSPMPAAPQQYFIRFSID